MSLLGLERIAPIRRDRRSNSGARSYFSPAEWREIDAALERGLTFEQIHDATRRYASARSFFVAYNNRRRSLAS